MTATLVDPDAIENIVGGARQQSVHLGRLTEDRETYILHSQDCLDTGRDLLECPYTLALDTIYRLPERQLLVLDLDGTRMRGRPLIADRGTDMIWSDGLGRQWFNSWAVAWRYVNRGLWFHGTFPHRGGPSEAPVTFGPGYAYIGEPW